MSKLLKRLIRLALSLAFIYAAYVIGTIAYASMTDYRPKAILPVAIENPNYRNPHDSVFTFLSWNIGYAGLGAEEDFFYDGGKQVRAPENRSKSYLSGIKSYLKEQKEVDFFLLQEVDSSARRSYGENHYRTIKNELSNYAAMFAFNYKVRYVPAPFDRPWDRMGAVHSGLATYTRFQPEEAERFQFPGNFDWPKSVFMLDRCFMLSRYKLSSGKYLVVLNTHNSAFDDGSLRSKQMAYIKDLVLEEYNNGNYVVVGGDWNQVPSESEIEKFEKGKNPRDESRKQMEANIFPEDWEWAFDESKATNRNLNEAWDPETTDTYLVDYFLLSPNIELLEVETDDLGYQNSDHQPVFMKIKLKHE